jgi:hypothetical protein
LQQEAEKRKDTITRNFLLMGEGTGDVVAVQIALCGDVGKTNLESEDDLSALKSIQVHV